MRRLGVAEYTGKSQGKEPSVNLGCPPLATLFECCPSTKRNCGWLLCVCLVEDWCIEQCAQFACVCECMCVSLSVPIRLQYHVRPPIYLQAEKTQNARARHAVVGNNKTTNNSNHPYAPHDAPIYQPMSWRLFQPLEVVFRRHSCVYPTHAAIQQGRKSKKKANTQRLNHSGIT